MTQRIELNDHEGQDNIDLDDLDDKGFYIIKSMDGFEMPDPSLNREERIIKAIEIFEENLPQHSQNRASGRVRPSLA